MRFQATPVPFETIAPFRDLYRRELGCQIVHDSAHYRENCFQSHLIEVDGKVAGYGSTWIGDYWMIKNSIFEFFLLPEFQPCLFSIFEDFLKAIEPPKLYAQTNDRFLGSLIFDYTQNVSVEHILFADGNVTNYIAPGVLFRRVLAEEKDSIFKHHVEPMGDWALDLDGRVIATGGFANHYNRPFRDIFMEVDAAFRQKGFGRFLVQEMKKACYQSGSVPSARCKPTNIASRKTLEAAGFIPCGRLIHGSASISKSKNES